MPSRNTIRFDADNSYYHVYSRGINKQIVYPDTANKDYFLYLLSRHLSATKVSSESGYSYTHLRGKIELLTYCLMDNHFHFLFYQRDAGALAKLMKSVMVSYTAYYNKQYDHIGPVFNGRYRASKIYDDKYLLHVSRYIHLNPRSWKRFPHSSFRHIIKSTEPEWLQTNRLLELHPSRAAYGEFVNDYEDYKRTLDTIKRDMKNM
jgi:hypothetical protein